MLGANDVRARVNIGGIDIHRGVLGNAKTSARNHYALGIGWQCVRENGRDGLMGAAHDARAANLREHAQELREEIVCRDRTRNR